MVNLQTKETPTNNFPHSFGGEIYYPESDGEPMAETDIHRNLINALIKCLELFFANRENVYVTGVCTDNDSSENYCTIKYNSSGEIIWVKKYHGGVGCKDEAVDIILDQNNNVYVTGYTFTNNFSQYFWSTLEKQ